MKHIKAQDFPGMVRYSLRLEAAGLKRTSRLTLPFPERRFLLVLLDHLAVNGALLLSLALRPEYSLSLKLFIQRPFWFLMLSALWLFLGNTFDAYDLRVSSRMSSATPAVLKAGLLTSIVYLLIPFLSPTLPASRLNLAAFPFLVVVLLLGGRFLYAVAFTQPIFQRRALIVGAGWAGRTIAQALVEQGSGVYHIVGFVDDSPGKLNSTLEIKPLRNRNSRNSKNLEKEAIKFKILGDRHALLDLIAQYRINTVVPAITHEVNGELLAVLMNCLELGVEIIPMPVLYERLTGRVPIEHVGHNWCVCMPLDHPGTSLFNTFVKRLSDILLASFGLICLGLAFPFIAAAIYINSPGPIFYMQERVGRFGRVFKAFKFRSMVPNAENGAAVWAKKKDSRVTRVGRILRKTHVDEFPQFINILKGEMSVVGPRAERPEFVEELAAEIPFYRVRHCVRPGMAGWGLVKQGYGGSREEAVLKLEYDLYYIKHQSLWLDMVILLKTIIDTLTFRGR